MVQTTAPGPAKGAGKNEQGALSAGNMEGSLPLFICVPTLKSNDTNLAEFPFILDWKERKDESQMMMLTCTSALVFIVWH